MVAAPERAAHDRRHASIVSAAVDGPASATLPVAANACLDAHAGLRSCPFAVR